jgi:hypothetical protein
VIEPLQSWPDRIEDLSNDQRSGISLSLLLWNDRDKQMRIMLSAGVDHVAPMVHRVFVAIRHRRFGVLIYVDALDYKSQFFSSLKTGAGGPYFDLERHNGSVFDLELSAMSKYGLILGRFRLIEFAM